MKAVLELSNKACRASGSCVLKHLLVIDLPDFVQSNHLNLAVLLPFHIYTFLASKLVQFLYIVYWFRVCHQCPIKNIKNSNVLTSSSPSMVHMYLQSQKFRSRRHSQTQNFYKSTLCDIIKHGSYNVARCNNLTTS